VEGGRDFFFFLIGKRLTFFVCVNGPDVPFEMLAAVEAFSAAFDFAHVQARVLRVRIGGCTRAEIGRHPAAAAFLGEVGDGCREHDA